MVGEQKLPITRACAHIGLARSSYYERPVTKCKADAPIADALNQVVAKNGRWGFRLCFDYLRNQGHTGKRAAAVMSLIQSAKMNGHDPYA